MQSTDWGTALGLRDLGSAPSTILTCWVTVGDSLPPLHLSFPSQLLSVQAVSSLGQGLSLWVPLHSSPWACLDAPGLVLPP